MRRLLSSAASLAILCLGVLLNSSHAQNCPCSIWSPSTAPGVVDGGDPSPGEYGVRFQVSINGYISGIRFYKAVTNGGMHIANLWSNSGALLATAPFNNETASGWQQVNFASPVPVTAGSTYVASYFAPAGHYSFNGGYFSVSAGTDPVTAPADGVQGSNGVFAYSGASTFPTSSYNSSNYWVDVSFETSLVPGVSMATPTGSGVSLMAPVSATFNEPIDPTSITTSSFELLDPSNNLVGASVTYNAAAQTALLQPSGALMPFTTYTAMLAGGSGGVRDLNGNNLPANYSWSFTTQAPNPICPCSVWNLASAPGIADSGDPTSGEYGFAFESDLSGSITALRFYKGAGNAGTHVGHIWSSTGALLGSATFTSESASGWQQVAFNPAVPITANTVYIASYFGPSGHYSITPAAFTASVDNAPLHAPANSMTPNGVYAYGADAFPANSYNASNYWVDVVFQAAGTIPGLKVLATAPTPGSSGASYGTTVSATLNEAVNSATVNTGSLVLVDGVNNPVPGTVTYDPTTFTVSFQPGAGFSPLATYTATLSGISDLSGNPLGASYSWTFTIGPPPANSGPGGPILVIASVINPFSRYYDEILRAEGLNEFTVADITTINSTVLGQYDVAILGDMTLTSAEASTLAAWVSSGGNLIAMHPDPQLSSLLGLTPLNQQTTDAYLLVNTSQAPGSGITGQTLQYHGPAELFSLNGATAIANLYSSSTQATPYPAVTKATAGSGLAAAFAYDLARSVVYSRQGNPAWSGQNRGAFIDPNTGDPIDRILAVDLFYGAASFDPKPDWIDLSKVQIPQADEQQRLLVNLILSMQGSKKPLPRFWYLPSGFKAAVIMSGDDHNQGGTVGRFQNYAAASAANCSVPDWQCIRATSYMWPGTPITQAQASAFLAQGFEFSFHPDSQPSCTDWTPGQLADIYAAYLEGFATSWPGLPAPATVRTHCITWSDYDTQPQVELSNNIRLDTNYYYWPDLWVQDQPGFFTGSGMPMRFANRNGNTIDVYQAVTQFPDETTWTWPADINTMLDNAVGPQGYYGVFTANMHTDYVESAGSDAIVAAAQAHGVPIVSALQMLTWLDGRNGSSFGGLAWDGRHLSFTIAPATGARNLQAMLPMQSSGGTLGTILLNGTPVPQSTQAIKGITYSFFNAAAGTYQAQYGYAITGTISGSGGSGVTVTLTGSSGATTTTDSSGNYIFGGLAPGTYTITPSQPGYLFTPQTVTLSSANVGSVNFTATLVSLQSVTISPATVTGGSVATATVTLNGTAPLTGAIVTLSTSNRNIATVPASITIAGGTSATTFNVSTSPVSTVSSVNVSATYRATFSAALVVNPPMLSSLTLNPGTLVGGNTSTGTVTLTGPAPASGTVVTLSDNSAYVSVPSSVTVSSGRTSATFTVSTSGVSSQTSASITASLGTSSTSASLLLTPPVVQSLSLAPGELVGGRSNSVATVTLNGHAPSAGAVVTLSSGTTSAATVPSSVTVPANATSATFTVTTYGVSVSTAATITATYNGTATALLTVDPLSLTSISLSPTSLIGGNSATGTATLNAVAPSTGTVVTLRSSSAAAVVPASVTIASGHTSATFTVSTSAVSGTTTATISGTYTTTASANLTITAPQVRTVSMSPTSVSGGLQSTGTVTLTGVAPQSGVVVSLSSSKTSAAQVPASVTVAAGNSTATFTVTTTPVSSSTTSTITAAGLASAVLTVTAPVLSSVALSPSTVKGGTNSTGTVTLGSPAPSGGAVVSLSSNNSTYASVPGSVTVAAGSTTANFTVTTRSTLIQRSATITGTYNGSRTATLTVSP